MKFMESSWRFMSIYWAIMWELMICDGNLWHSDTYILSEVSILAENYRISLYPSFSLHCHCPLQELPTTSQLDLHPIIDHGSKCIRHQNLAMSFRNHSKFGSYRSLTHTEMHMSHHVTPSLPNTLARIGGDVFRKPLNMTVKNTIGRFPK